MTRHFIEVVLNADGWWVWRCTTCDDYGIRAEKRDAVNDADAHLTAMRGVAHV